MVSWTRRGRCRGAPAALAALAALLAGVGFARVGRAQECRRTCLVEETRDAQGCCVPPQTGGTGVRCPAGTSWSETQHACVGRRVCPSGSHADGARCVADAVGCPAGAERREGRCVLQITCPPGSERVRDRCVAPVTCPQGTTLVEGACVSREASCPAGTSRRPDGGCAAMPVCPGETRFIEGRGCLAPLVCPPLSHVQGEQCVPDHACPDGEQFVDGRCQSVCASIGNARWDGARRACVCNDGFLANEGRCQPTSVAANVMQCPAGTRADGAQCVAEVSCPTGFAYVAGRGCVDLVLERRLTDERGRELAEERARRARFEADERHRIATRWGRGPGVQLSAGGGYQFFYMPNAYRAIVRDRSGSGAMLASTGAAVWNGGILSAGASLIFGDLSLTASYAWAPGSAWASGEGPGRGRPAGPACPDPTLAQGASLERMDDGWCVTSAPMHLAMLDVGQQGVGPRHAWRVGVGAGWEFSAGALATQVSYRSTVRLVAGLFVAIEARVLGMVRLLPFDIAARDALQRAEVSQTPRGFTRDGRGDPLAMRTTDPFVEHGAPGAGVGGAALVSLGYALP